MKELYWPKNSLLEKSRSGSREDATDPIVTISTDVLEFKEEANYMGALIGGPWTIFGHYVIIKPWSPNFNPLTDVINTSPAWIQLHDLPLILYEEGVLLQLASAIENPIKVDQRTLHANRDRFARICIELDLARPLKGAIIINEAIFLVEYDGHHTICFSCGRFGHFQPACPHDPKDIARKAEFTSNKGEVGGCRRLPKKERPWGMSMSRPQRRRTDPRKDKDARPGATNPPVKSAAKSRRQSLGGERFDVLVVVVTKESNQTVGVASADEEGQNAIAAKEKTGGKSEKGKQKWKKEVR
ncbi:hypothetical protein V2J09_003244 [Rumex salicifolius]